MIKPISILFSVTLIAITSCSSHDAELEKDLNARIDKFGNATIDFCNCVSDNKEDCKELYDAANVALDEMQKLHDLESEQNIDQDMYSSMLESAGMYRTDFFTCSNTMHARMRE